MHNKEVAVNLEINVEQRSISEPRNKCRTKKQQ